MLQLIQTLFDITMLRKGPEHIPHSGVVLSLCIGLWLFGLFAMMALVPMVNENDGWISFASWVFAIGCYLTVLSFSGRLERTLQTVSALAGSGALITFAMLSILVFATPFLGEKIANQAAVLVLFWSIPVKGHIIARAIERHWYIGIVLAMIIFVLQFVFSASMTPEPVS